MKRWFPLVPPKQRFAAVSGRFSTPSAVPSGIRRRTDFGGHRAHGSLPKGSPFECSNRWPPFPTSLPHASNGDQGPFMDGGADASLGRPVVESLHTLTGRLVLPISFVGDEFRCPTRYGNALGSPPRPGDLHRQNGVRTPEKYSRRILRPVSRARVNLMDWPKTSVRMHRANAGSDGL